MNSKHVVSAPFIRVYVYCQGAYVIEGGRVVLPTWCVIPWQVGFGEQHSTVVQCSHSNMVLQQFDKQHVCRVVSVVGHGHDLIT